MPAKSTNGSITKKKNNIGNDDDIATTEVKEYDATQHDTYGENWNDKNENDVDIEDDWEDDDVNDEEEDVEVEGIEIGDDVGDDEECAFDGGRKGRSKKIGMIDREDDDGDGASENDDDDAGEASVDIITDISEYRTVAHLTKYEKPSLLGTRTTQLAQGAKPMIIGVENLRPKTIAQLELESGMMPLYIFRPLPNGKQERLMVGDLKLKKTDVIYGFKGGRIDADAVKKIDQLIQDGGNVMGYRDLIKDIQVNVTDLSKLKKIDRK